MITSINRLVDKEDGSVAVEGTFVTLFLSVLLIYTMQQALVMSVQFSINKLADQMVNIISHRDSLFGNANLSQGDVVNVAKMFSQIKNGGEAPFFDVFVEEIAYATGQYSMYKLPGSKEGCQLTKRLTDYGIDIKTSFGKSNSVYRVSICKKTEPGLFSKNKTLLADSAIQIGHHH